MSTTKRDYIDNLHEKISITLDASTYTPIYQEAIKKLAKNIQLPGFRKGNVPSSLVAKNYGQSVFFEEILKIAEKNLFDFLQENKLNILYQPLLIQTNLYDQKTDSNNPINFEFEIGIEPSFSLDFLKNIHIDSYNIQLTQEAIDGELKYYQNYYAQHQPITQFQDKDADYLKGTIQLATEQDDTQNKKPFNVFMKNIKDDIFTQKYKHLKTGDTFDFSFLDIVDNMQDKYLQSLQLDTPDKLNAQYKITIEDTLKTIPHDLNPELYKLVFGDKTTIQTEQEFLQKIQTELQAHYALQSKNHAVHLLSHEIGNHYNFDIPKTFLKKWIEQQSQKDNKATPKTYSEDEIKSFFKYVQQSIFQNKIIHDNNINVSQNELQDAIRGHILGQFGQYIVNESQIQNFVSNALKDQKYVKEIEDNVINTKIYDIIFNLVTKTPKDVTEKEFIDAVKKHNDLHHSHDHTH